MIPLYILPAEDEEGGWALGGTNLSLIAPRPQPPPFTIPPFTFIGGANRFWQHHGLNHLQHALKQAGSALVLRRALPKCGAAEIGAEMSGSLREVLSVVSESGATAPLAASSCL